MSKTPLTKQLESALFNFTNKIGVFGCFEVSTGFNADCVERVDFMTFDTKGVFRCYEIKVTKSDFRSKNHNTFCGNYNYYVLPSSLAADIKDEIPRDIGIVEFYPSTRDDIDNSFVEITRRAEKKNVDRETAELLKTCLIRSLCRESDKAFKSQDVNRYKAMKAQLQAMEKNAKADQKSYQDAMLALRKAEAEKNNLLEWISQMTSANAIDWSCGTTISSMLEQMPKAKRRAREYGMISQEEEDMYNALYAKIYGQGQET